MYQIVIDNRDGERYILHDSRSNKIRVINAKCDMELSKTGTLSFKINPNHPNFDKIFKHKSEIYLFQDDECLFCGRVLNDEVDIYNFKTVTCEGMLGYLLDSIQRAKAYSITGDTKIKDYLTDILKIHNSQVDNHKQFSVGIVSEVDTSETFYKISSYEDTLTTINNDLVETFKHTYLIAGFKDGQKVINYVNSSELPINNQVIRFGKNLLKLNRKLKGEEIATVIIPLGVNIDSEETENGTVDYKLTIEELPNGLIEGSIYKQDDYIYDEEAIKKYGRIVKSIEWSEEEDAQALQDKAVEQLNYYNKLASTLELNAFDLHLLDVSIDSFRLGQKVRVYSPNHKLDDYLIVQKISIDIDNPDKTTICLGNEERVSIDVISSLSKKNNQNNDDLNSLEKDLDNNKWDYLGKDYFNSDDYKDQFNSDFGDTFKDYSGTDLFNDAMNDYFNSQSGNGELTDLSKYALKEDVQESFDILADLLGEV